MTPESGDSDREGSGRRGAQSHQGSERTPQAAPLRHAAFDDDRATVRMAAARHGSAHALLEAP